MDSIVVPGDGFTLFRRNPAQTFTFDAMGPLSAGDFIRRVELHWSLEQTGVWSFSGSLGTSRVADAASLEAGMPLIQRSSFGAYAAQDGPPAIVMLAPAGQAGRMAIYPGLKVTAGSSWIIVEIGSQSAGATASVLVSVEIWRKQPVRKVDAEVG
jgi:hypothetical protein